MNKEYKELEVLSARLAESVLMDWDKEEQVRLAKEVATKCHSIFNDKESREFVSLVKRMREAQIKVDSHAENYDYWLEVEGNLQARVDEYLRNNYERR